MEMTSTPRPPRGRATAIAWGAAALAAGSAVGWLDISATEVQGPLLLFLCASFALALSASAPAWLIGIGVAAGLPLAHALGALASRGDGASAGMLMVVVPCMVAAYAGRLAGTVVANAARHVPLGGMADDSLPWRARATSGRALLGAILVACTAIGVAPVYATLLARAQPNAWWVTIIWQVLSFGAWLLVAPLVFHVGRADDERGASARALAAHAVLVLGVGIAHAAALVLVTRVLFIPIGASGPLTAIAWSAAAYVPVDALAYVLLILLAHAADGERLARAGRSREAALSSTVNEHRLAALRAQLRPHFFFNALNAASVLARRGDADGASEVLSALADVLRRVLDDRVDPVRLSEEIELIERYLAVERVRFGDRMHVEVDADDEARAALVPHLVLQPLVENAVRHGIAARAASGLVRIRAWRDGARLRATVEDDGPGPGGSDGAAGIGLRNTRARLEALYGRDATLELRARDGGAAIATLTIPFAS
ncbi:MAG: histidine kinase [Gemmatimonadaceae bacterium]